ncbi:MAG: glycerophosphodiester phosphodiesterase [Dehalococcoidia bacterium]|nr:glycerophosphodiester phosphodiesterase [Dehalococcoidia bacterium]MDW8119935.1 glycerophosphodiester phosphodiesterase [Chloroflexota bacterium]
MRISPRLPYREFVRQRRPVVVAHRGAMAFAPENTIAAFTLALEQGAEVIELDVHLSKDGIPVVIHDHTLERTTNGKGLVSAHTFEALRTLDAGAWFDPAFAGQRILSLGEVLAWAQGRAYLKIELKTLPMRYPGIEEKVLVLLQRWDMEEQVEVFSFDHPCVRRFKQMAPHIPVGVCYSADVGDHVALARYAGAEVLHPHWTAISREMVEKAHAAGLWVDAWTVNDPQVVRTLVEWGVDFLKTDAPAQIREALGQR